MKPVRLSCALLLSLGACTPDPVVVACDGGLHDDAPATDAPSSPDTPADAAEACAGARTITLVEGDNHVTGDTTGRTSEGMAIYCGEAPSPWELVALEVPGASGDDALLHIELDGEATAYPIVFEWRPAGCDDRTDSTCLFWDGMDGFLPRGDVAVPAGSTLYVYVTGRDEDAFGAWALDVNVDARIEAPVLTAATFTRVDAARYAITFDGTDADGDVISLTTRFFDASGAVVPYTDRFTGVESESFTPYLEGVFLGPTFGGRAQIGEYLGEDAVVEGTATAVEVELTLRDTRGNESAPLRVAITSATDAALGEACGATAACAFYQTCRGGVCAGAPACDAIPPLALTPGTPVARTLTLPVGLGGIDRPCSFSAGTEALFGITVPAPASPVASYELRVLGTTDGRPFYTVDDCAVPPEYGAPVCNYVGNAAPVAPGNHTLVIEHGYTTGPETVDVEITLVPVLEGGAACDPTGAANRCGVGVCPDVTSPTCPDTCSVFDVGACGAGRACEWQYTIPGDVGICVAAGTAALGEPCTPEMGVSTGCVDGLSCSFECVPFCDATHPCPGGGACPSFGDSPGTCFP